MADSFGAIAEAFVRLRSKADGSFEKDAREAVLPGLRRVAEDAALLFAGKKLFDVGRQGLAELKEAEVVAAQTASAIRATGGAAGVTSEQVAELSGSLSELSGKDDELIAKGANLLLTFKNVKNGVGESNQVFDRATKAALDLSTAGFGSVESASVLMGKALNDPIRGLTALGRSGVTFSEAQKEVIKELVESNDLLSAQKIILKEVESQVGGAAEAYGKTLAGSLERAQTSLDNAKASLVQGFAPAIQLGADITAKLASALQELPPELQALAGGIVFLGGTFATVSRPVVDLLQLLDRLKIARKAAAAAAQVEAGANAALAASQGAVAAGTTAATIATGGLALAAAGAVTGLLYLSGAFDSGNDRVVDAKTGTDAYTVALRENTAAAIDNATAHLVAGKDASEGAKEISRTLQGAGVDLNVFFDEVRNGTGDLGKLQYNSKLARLEVRTLADGKTDMIGLREELQKAADGGSVFARSLLDARNEGRLTDIQLVDIIRTTNDLSGSLGDARSAQELFKGVVSETGGEFDETTGSIKSHKEALKEAQEAAKNLQATYQSIIDKTLGAFGAGLSEVDAAIATRKALQDLADVPGDQASKDAALAESVADASDSVADAQERLAKARKRVNEADTESERQSALEAVASATEAVTEAQERLAEAQGKQADQTATNVEREDELTSKTNAALKAILAQAEAHRKSYEASTLAASGTIDAAESNRRLIEELTAVRNTLEPGSPLAAAIDGYIAQLNNVPTNVQTELQIRYSETGDVTILQQLNKLQSQAAADALGISLEEYIRRANQENIIAGSGARALGGPVNAGELYRVNENQTEWFRPSTGGEVALTPLGTSQPSIVNNNVFYITPTEPEPAARETVRQLRRFAAIGPR